MNVYTFFSPFSQAYLEAAAPRSKFGLNLNYTVGNFSTLISATRFSEVRLQDFQWVDSPATNEAEANALFETATDIYEAAVVLDLSVSYRIIDGLRLTVGANNLLNAYPTPQFDGWTDQGGFNDSVQMGSDGRYIFARIGFNF